MNKKGVAIDTIVWIVIAVAVLAIVMVAIFLLKDKGIGMIDTIKNLFRGR